MNLVSLERYNKYSNIKTIAQGIAFDSRREAIRYEELVLLQKAKEINDLHIQQPFLLQEGFTDKQGVIHKPIYYIADFYYWETKDPEHIVVEDTKGMKTDVYRLKKKILLHQYPDIIFRET